MPTPQSDLSLRKAILQKIGDMKENDFSREVLVPIFSREYDKVEFYGGAGEGGKDLVCWRTNKLHDTEVVVVQVKRLKATSASSGKGSFPVLITQLGQAAETGIPVGPEQEIFPSAVIFVTPYPIPIRAWGTKLDSLRRKIPNLRVYDGNRICDILIEGFSIIVSGLVGKMVHARHAMIGSLTNSELLRALRFAEIKDLSTFYCDLNFGIGKINTRFFLQFNELRTNKVKAPYLATVDDWKKIKDCRESAESYFKRDLISVSDQQIEDDYERRSLLFEQSQQSSHEKLTRAKIRPFLKSWSLRLELFSYMPHLAARKADPTKQQRRIYEMLDEKRKLHENRGNSEFYDSIISKINSLAESYRNIYEMADSLCHNEVWQYTDPERLKREKLERLRKIEADASSLEIDVGLPPEFRIGNSSRTVTDIVQDYYEIASAPRPSYKIPFDRELISGLLIAQRIWLQDQAATFRNKPPSGNLLRRFLTRCNSLFSAVEAMRCCPGFSECFHQESSKIHLDVNDLPHLEISIHDVFDSRLNIVLFGEAGSGKTTSLQMYAKRKLESDDEELTLFIPLARTQCINIEHRTMSDQDQVRTLTGLVGQFLSHLELKTSLTELEHRFRTERCCLIFDGLDEVVGKAPWIIKSLALFSEQFPKAQLIVSSRMYDSLLSALPFLGFTLLPFTEDQRSDFFRQWFGSEKVHNVKIIERHLRSNKDLADIVSSPLLATVLCILCNSDVNLPRTEIEMYEERFRLLLGHFDREKDICRLSSSNRLLELLTRKIALKFHEAERRSAPLEEIFDMVYPFTEGRWNISTVKQGLSELIDPCSILVPMSAYGGFGYGHLRFQEYCVAWDMRENRSIDVIKKLRNHYWKGPLIIYSKLADDFSFFIDTLSRFDNLGSVNDIVMEMMSNRPKSEQRRFAQLRKKRRNPEGHRSAFLEKAKIDGITEDDLDEMDFEDLGAYLEVYKEEEDEAERERDNKTLRDFGYQTGSSFDDEY